MAVGQEDLLKKANELELKESHKNKTNPAQISALGALLHDAYVTGRPEEIDYNNRRDLVRIFNEITKEIFGRSSNTPVIEEYGSFVMDIFSPKSDLDLSVNLVSNSAGLQKNKKIQMLRSFAQKFYAMQRMGHVSGVQPILSAKVPILKLVDRGTGIECDISIENRDGIVKSQIVRMISLIDSRFQMLSFLMKAWAKANKINSAAEHTLNSLSIISLVAFHLQTRDPPILPPFSAIMKGGTEPMSVKKEVANFVDYGKRNKESLGELFVSLLNKLASVETLWDQGLCASTYEGSWIQKDFGPKLGCVKVEDFTDRSQNISRAVRSIDLDKIYKRINLSIESVSAFMEGKIETTKLRELLFGQTLAPAALKEKSVSLVPVPSLKRVTAETSISTDPKPKKKKRPAVPPVDPKPKGTQAQSVSVVPVPSLKKGIAESSTSVNPKSNKKMRPAVPPVDPKPKKNMQPVVPPVVSCSEGRGGIPPVNLGRTTPVSTGASRVWRNDLPTENWGRMIPMGLGTGTPLANWGSAPAAAGLGITPDVLATLIGLTGITTAGLGGPPSNIWGRTATEGFVGAPRVGHYGVPTVARGVTPENWGRASAEGLRGTLGVGHYGGPTVTSENWGRQSTEGLRGSLGIDQYGGPTVGRAVTPSENWGRQSTEGLRGGLGVGRYGGPTVGRAVTPSENWGRQPTEGLRGTIGGGQYGGPTVGRGVAPSENWGGPAREGLGGTRGVDWHGVDWRYM